MKTKKVTFDFSDAPKVLDLLRLHSREKVMTQKAILIEALSLYFSQEQKEFSVKNHLTR